MSTLAPAPTALRQYGRVLRHFIYTRALEVGALQASPLLGASLGGLGLHGGDLRRLVMVMLGSVALTAHVFVFNDWADYSRDARDLRRASDGTNAYGSSRDQLAALAIVLLALALGLFATVSLATVVCAAAVAALSLLYSFSPRLGKRTPVAASLNHLVGGALHFLLGFTAARAIDADGVLISLVFGLVFAAGHLNQEVRDADSDRANAVSTVAVRFGTRRGFLVSFALFSVAYGLIVVLAIVGALPELLLISAVLWLAQASWSMQALRRGLSAETALWMQRRYRLLFALVGLAMLI